VQWSLFITLGYLRIKRRKLGFIRCSSLENKQKVGSYPVPGTWLLGAGRLGQQGMLVPGEGCIGTGVWRRAPEVAPQVRFLLFSSRFRSFFRLKTPEFSSLCIVFKTFEEPLIFNFSSLILHMMS